MLGSIHNSPRGEGYDDFEGGSLSLPTTIQGGLWKICNENDIEHRGKPTMFSWKRKGKENMLLEALIIPVFALNSGQA